MSEGAIFSNGDFESFELKCVNLFQLSKAIFKHFRNRFCIHLTIIQRNLDKVLCILSCIYNFAISSFIAVILHNKTGCSKSAIARETGKWKIAFYE